MSVYEQQDMARSQRELVAEIKTAWYNVAMAEGIYSMLADTRKLLIENVRVNKKLVENDKVTRDYLLRSETELSKFEQELQNAEKNKNIAAAYFNFLLNKPLADSVITEQVDSFPLLSGITEKYTTEALENREELKKLGNYSNISGYQVKMNESGKLPDMFVAVDYGFQGEKYMFNRNQDYVQA